MVAPLITGKEGKAPHGGKYVRQDELDHFEANKHEIHALVNAPPAIREALVKEAPTKALKAITTLSRLALEHGAVPEEHLDDMMILASKSAPASHRRKVLTGEGFGSKLRGLWKLIQILYHGIAKYGKIIMAGFQHTRAIDASTTKGVKFAKSLATGTFGQKKGKKAGGRKLGRK